MIRPKKEARARPWGWRDVSLDDLALFAEVGRREHFGRAAEALGLPASTLSRRVARLEAALELRLLARSTRKVTLTEAGSALLSSADAPLERLTELLNEGHENGGLGGTLRVAAPAVAGRDILGPLLLEFVAQHPRLRLELKLGNQTADLLEERIDFAFRLGPLPDSELVGRRVWSVEYGVYGGAGLIASPVPLESLAERPAIIVPPMYTWPFVSEAGEFRRFRPAARDRLDDFSVALRAVELGRGLAYLPIQLVEGARRADLSPVVFDGWRPAPRSMYLVHPPAPTLSPRVRAAVDFMVRRLAASAPLQSEEIPA